MVRVYTWLPPSPLAIVEGAIGPDLGHGAIELIDKDDKPYLYISFWPDLDGIEGRLTTVLKHRRTRQPSCLADEVDPDGYFLQRPPDFIDEVGGLDEHYIVSRWRKLKDKRYHFHRWNCSDVCKRLLLLAMSRRDRRIVRRAATCGTDLPRRRDYGSLMEWLRALASSRVVACTPEDVRRLVSVYNSLHEGRARNVAVELAAKTV